MIEHLNVIIGLIAQTLIVGAFFMRVEHRITKCEIEITSLEKNIARIDK